VRHPRTDLRYPGGPEAAGRPIREVPPQRQARPMTDIADIVCKGTVIVLGGAL